MPLTQKRVIGILAIISLLLIISLAVYVFSSKLYASEDRHIVKWSSSVNKKSGVKDVALLNGKTALIKNDFIDKTCSKTSLYNYKLSEVS